MNKKLFDLLICFTNRVVEDNVFREHHVTWENNLNGCREKIIHAGVFETVKNVFYNPLEVAQAFWRPKMIEGTHSACFYIERSLFIIVGMHFDVREPTGEYKGSKVVKLDTYHLLSFRLTRDSQRQWAIFSFQKRLIF